MGEIHLPFRRTSEYLYNKKIPHYVTRTVCPIKRLCQKKEENANNHNQNHKLKRQLIILVTDLKFLVSGRLTYFKNVLVRVWFIVNLKLEYLNRVYNCIYIINAKTIHYKIVWFSGNLSCVKLHVRSINCTLFMYFLFRT